MTTAAIQETRTLEFTYDIFAPVKQVWESFTNRDNVADWLSHDSHVRIEEGGFIFFSWYEGPFAIGTVKTVIEHEKIAFTWDDGSDHPTTKVKVLMIEDGNKTQLTLKHIGFEDDERLAYYDDMWKTRLKNLKSTLETGANSLITDRVIIGFYPNEFNAQVAESLNVPVTEGARVGGLVAGYSAEAAGLQPDDVIVEVAGTAINADTPIHSISEGKVPGDVVNVVYYRGADRHSVDVALRGYPIPDIPENFAALANTFEAAFNEQDATLRTLLDGVDDASAEKSPEGGEGNSAWNTKQVLAHLILSRRHTLEWLSTYIEGPRRINPYTHVAGRINAILAIFPSVDDLLDEFSRTGAEAIAIIRQFPPELAERKNHMWWIVFESQYTFVNFPNVVERIENLLK